MGPRRTMLSPEGSSLPGPPPQRRCCGFGGWCWLAAGRGRQSEEVAGGVEAVSEGGDVTHPPGGGAAVEGEVTVPVRKEEDC